MTLYYAGFNEALDWVKKQTDIEELLNYIDTLYGRDNIEDVSDFDEVFGEAIRQCRESFTDKSSNEYSLAQFHVKLYQANQRY